MRLTNRICGLSAIFALILTLSLFSTDVVAHSDIEKVRPDINSILEEIPNEIAITLADPVYLYSDSIQIKDPQGNLINIGKPTIDPKDNKTVFIPIPKDLRPDKYTVYLNVIAKDGHELNEKFIFEISQNAQKDIKEDVIIADDKEEVVVADVNNIHIEKTIPHDGEIIKYSANQIELWFTDEIGDEIAVLTGLFNDRMEQIEINKGYINPENRRNYIIELKNTLKDGSHQVNWYTQGSSGGRSGIFNFAVNEVTSIAYPELGFSIVNIDIEISYIAKWLSYVGVFLLFGGVFFQLFISKGTEYLQRWNRIVNLIYIISFIGFATLIIIRIYDLENVQVGELFTFQFMWLTLVQFILLAVTFWIKSIKYRLFTISSVIFLWSFLGHSSVLNYGGLYSKFLDLTHLYATAIWFGGLFALIIMMPKESTLQWLKKYGKSYSKFAVPSIIILFLSGIGMTIQYVPSFSMESLLLSNWGTFLLFKVLLFMIIIGFGLFQMVLLKSKKIPKIRIFSLNSLAEIIIGAIIVLLAASLVSSSPKTAEQGVYPRQTSYENDVKIAVEILPLKIGYTDILIEVKTVQSIENVDIILSMPPDYERKLRAFNLGSGRFKVTGGLMHSSGTIFLDVLVETSSGTIKKFPYIIQVPGQTM